MDIFTKEWWAKAGVRALKTFCQTFGSSGIILSVANGSVDWTPVLTALVTAFGAAILSFITSLGGLPEVSDSANKEGDDDA